MTVVVWFRDDLRLSDHPALDAAAAVGAVVPVFVRDEAFADLGGAARWWLHQALASLGHDIAAKGGHLNLMSGDAAECLSHAAAQAGADEIHALAARIPADRARQETAAQKLAEEGVRLVLHPGALLHAPKSIRTGAGTAYSVFTPFWRSFAATDVAPAAPSPPPVQWGDRRFGEPLGSFGLLPTAPDWAGGLRETWAVGEAAAGARLEAFVADGLADYARTRDRPDLPGTSRLSPDLRWGHLSPARVWRRVRMAIAADPACETGGWAFLRQLGWREFSHHVLDAHPDLATRNLKAGFDAFPWRHDRAALACWTSGETGFPLVDAAMRELWHTGWMHNRCRMVVASFLIKDLRQDWRTGLAWFDDTLVDADPALDPFGWQWVAGSGADAAPFFRVFNPIAQGKKFDPDGDYIARWLPERAALPAAGRHALGARPVVDHDAARHAALADWKRAMAGD